MNSRRAFAADDHFIALNCAETRAVISLELFSDRAEVRAARRKYEEAPILSHPIESLAESTVELLASVTAGETNGEIVQRLLAFDIYTPENL